MKGIRIGFDVRPGNGGPTRYVASLVRALDALEWEVAFIDRKSQSLPRETTSLGNDTHLDRSPARARKRVRLIQFAPRFARLWTGFRGDARRVAKAIRPLGVDLFHAQATGCEEMPVAARLAGCKNVLGTFHVDETNDLNRNGSGFAHRALAWYSNRNLHRAIAVSEATRRYWIRRTGIPDHRVVTIHNGIDPERIRRHRSKIEARRMLGLPTDALVVGCLGRLEEVKGFTYLIEAAALLRESSPQLVVAIAGQGALREQLEAKAQALGVTDRVVFLGFLLDVNPVLDALDLFALPSLCEALPFALLEAMAHELPAVGTTVGGVPEVIVPYETGMLVPPRDPKALAAALKPLIESAELRERLGKAGRERVCRHFQESEMVSKTIDVYQTMLAGRPNRSATV